LKESQSTVESAGDGNYVLRLYVTGTTPRSVRAIANIKSVCEKYLRNRYALEVIDIFQQPALAQREQIVAVPTLIKLLPTPLRKMIGDLASVERVLDGLDLQVESEPRKVNEANS
jgi:circadian clock protein KaiB